MRNIHSWGQGHKEHVMLPMSPFKGISGVCMLEAKKDIVLVVSVGKGTVLREGSDIDIFFCSQVVPMILIVPIGQLRR